jgi:hypothetical protein
LVPSETTVLREEAFMKAAWPFGRFLAPAFRARLLSVVTLCGACLFATAASQSAHVNSLATQEFFCYAGLDHHECLQNIAKLRAELVRYSADLPERWSWVIIGSENWQSVVLKLHVDRRSPAFTAIDARETFLEEALFSPTPPRRDELSRDLGVPVDQLLTLAVSHELGHAICHEGDEAIANRVSDQLRSGEKIDCTDSLTRMEELYLRRRPMAFRRGDPRATGCVVPISSVDCK